MLSERKPAAGTGAIAKLPVKRDLVDGSSPEWTQTTERRPIRDLSIALAFLVLGIAAGLLLASRVRPGIVARRDPDRRLVSPRPFHEQGSRAPCFWGVALTGESTTVLADADGRVEELLVRLGTDVAAGALLARIDARVPRKQVAIAEASLAAAVADEQRGASELAQIEDLRNRLERLGSVAPEEEKTNADHHWRSRREELASARALVAERRVRVEQARLALSETAVRAPFSGAISDRFVNAGTLVTRGSPMFVIVGRGKPFVRFGVPPADAGRIRVAADLAVIPETGTDPLRGRVTHISPEIDSASRLVHMEASLDQNQQEDIRIANGAAVCVRAVALAASGTLPHE
jgi:RND family efflux transporter MFP subunit